MKRIAVFGKPGSGKSTFSRQLAAVTNIPLYPLDLIEYQKNGEKVSASEYNQVHRDLIKKESWVIDGLGSLDSFWERLKAADTLIYIDLPYRINYWWVTKRLLTGLFRKPQGWPKGSSILKGTIASYKYLRLSPKFWTEALYQKIKASSPGKTIYRIRTVEALNQLLTKQQT